MRYLDEAASLPALRAALDRAVRKRGGPGPDGVTLADFAATAESELPRLRDEILSGVYQPLPGRQIALPKPGGGRRTLVIGCVRDRVVQGAIATTLSSRLDAALHDCAYAYRRGRSARDALAEIDRALAAGRLWVLRADIEDFFDSIEPRLLLAALAEVTEEPELVALVETLLKAGALVGGEIADSGGGTPQGSPISPFLANLYLKPFDTAVEGSGFHMVRYADDVCINVVSREDAERALNVVRESLVRLRLSLNAKKVEIRHLGQGFVFLGFQFGIEGRRAGAKAARRLVEQVEVSLRERPKDGGEEIDELLSGWLGYYGSLAGVELPEAVRGRAAALENARAESILGDSGVESGENSTVAAATVAPPLEASRWGRAALRLAAASGSEEQAGVSEEVRSQCEWDGPGWPEIAAALAAFDGAAAAEILARVGRFGDAAEAAEIAAPPPIAAAPTNETRGAPSTRDEGDERPRLESTGAAAERLLELFGGAEHSHVQRRLREGRIGAEPVAGIPSCAEARDHLAGERWIGVYPLLANDCVRFAALRVLLSVRARKALADPSVVPPEVAGHVRALLRALSDLELRAAVSLEPGRGYVVWIPFAAPIPAVRARAVLRIVCDRAGSPPPSVSRELVPAQEKASRDKPGTAVFWPLGLDGRTGARAWFCDARLEPLPDQSDYLRTLAANDMSGVAGLGDGDGAASVESLFHGLPRAQQVYRGCNVLRHFVDKATRGDGATSSERYFMADVLGRLGDEASPALEAVFHHLQDYRPGLATRYLERIYPNPTSCGRIREKLPEVTARVGCDCKFRVPPRAYPTPALHAVGAAEIPALAERIREAARRGGRARAERGAEEAGRAERGDRAAALCARLADLRRQLRSVERALAAAEAKLDELVDEAGDGVVETPTGTLRRVTENGLRRFVLDL